MVLATGGGDGHAGGGYQRAPARAPPPFFLLRGRVPSGANGAREQRCAASGQQRAPWRRAGGPVSELPPEKLAAGGLLSALRRLAELPLFDVRLLGEKALDGGGLHP